MDVPNIQIFILGTYYAHNINNITKLNIYSIISQDSEIAKMSKMILSEIRGANMLLFDIKTNKLETMSIAFLLENLNLLNDFTSMQSFFLGVRAGAAYDQSNIKLQ